MATENQDNQAREDQEKNMKAVREVVIAANKHAARSEALRYAPNRKEDPNSKCGVLLTASEIKDEAEIIYQWLIKDL